ncbi:MAG: BON domain-containing protein [Proteobacteria bacterium]|nr:BON domain-containing protein [Pseudomonadota bacterium]
MNSRTNAVAACLVALLVAGGGSAFGESLGEAASDSWLTAKTKIALAADGRVAGRQVSVETDDGCVFLRGKVDTPEARSAAEEIARDIENVTSVKNELQVVAPSRRPAVDESDAAVTARVKKALSRDKILRRTSIGVTTNDGVVSLSGTAPDFKSRAKASWDAWKVDGVKSVKNDLDTKD